MRRGPKILLWTVSGLVLLVAAAVLFIALFNWNLAKPTLNEKVSEALGRPFAINGDLQVRWTREPELGGWRAWVPWPHFYAHDITLDNADWGKSPRMATLERIDFRLAPLPLLAQTISIPRIHLIGPQAELERMQDGRANWDLELAKNEDENEQPSNWKLDIGTISFDRAQVALRDATLRTDMTVQVEPLGEPIAFSDIMAMGGQEGGAGQGEAAGPDGPPPGQPEPFAFAWKAEGSYQKQKLSGEGKIGGLLALQASDRPFPLQADVRAGSTRIALAGTLTDPLNLGALDLKLRLSGASMSQLYGLTGVTLPDTPPYYTDGRLRASLNEPGGAVYSYEGFTGKVGASDLSGDLRYVAASPRPSLSGKLRSNLLQLADLGPLIGVQSHGGQSKQAPQEETAKAAPGGKVLPREQFRTDRWAAMDADVTLTGKRIVHSEKLPLSNLDAHLVLKEGVLSLEPLRFGMAGGALDANIRLDGSRTPMPGRVQLRARNLKLKELFPGFEPMRTSLGELNGNAALTGTGNSVAALLGTANGELKILMNDGAISRGLTEIAGLNVANYLVTQLFGDDTVQINCAAADLRFRKGVAEPEVFLFDTENALVTIDGPINLRDETLDLDVRPHSKGFRIFSLRSPLYVRGTFADPKAGVQAGPLVARGAGMIALGALLTPVAGVLALVAPSVGEENACAGLVADMKKAPKAR
ncbi:AsmA family protein [Orrella sp. JC864]|uniref:AsmA family protein n=1 Tax=Orrella sp. JC864 TaxID=3120298 RepID=UPI003008F6DC